MGGRVSHERVQVTARHRVHVLVHVVADDRWHHKWHFASSVSSVIRALVAYAVVVDDRVQVPFVVVCERQTVLGIFLGHDVLCEIVQMILFLLQLQMQLLHGHLLAMDIYEVQIA